MWLVSDVTGFEQKERAVQSFCGKHQEYCWGSVDTQAGVVSRGLSYTKFGISISETVT